MSGAYRLRFGLSVGVDGSNVRLAEAGRFVGELGDNLKKDKIVSGVDVDEYPVLAVFPISVFHDTNG